MPLTLSIGLTEAVADDDTVTLIARADKALYKAKSDGRNCGRVVTADAGAENAEVAPGTAPIGAMLLSKVEHSALQR